MASLKEIKARIASIQSTQKITAAMRMVASAKLRRTQAMTENFLRYKETLHQITAQLHTTPPTPDTPATTTTAPTLIIPISSNSGLCGAYNNNIAKATRQRIAQHQATNTPIHILPIGKKIATELAKTNQEYIPQHINILEKTERDNPYTHVTQLLNTIIQLQQQNHITTVEIIHHHFKSMGSQTITITTIDLTTHTHTTTHTTTPNNHYITEPDPAQLLQALHPRLLQAQLYGTLLDAQTSEHAARMLAMQTADDNANELLRELTLLYNKTRQQAITNELIDIMGGKQT